MFPPVAEAVDASISAAFEIAIPKHSAVTHPLAAAPASKIEPPPVTIFAPSMPIPFVMEDRVPVAVPSPTVRPFHEAIPRPPPIQRSPPAVLSVVPDRSATDPPLPDVFAQRTALTDSPKTGNREFSAKTKSPGDLSVMLLLRDSTELSLGIARSEITFSVDPTSNSLLTEVGAELMTTRLLNAGLRLTLKIFVLMMLEVVVCEPEFKE